jgi:uncharacterized BrkB/YihY/UPF0761 family membrane protein
VLTSRVRIVRLTTKRSVITIYNDVYDEHLFVFAAGLPYYFVLSLFPLLVSMASLATVVVNRSVFHPSRRPAAL